MKKILILIICILFCSCHSESITKEPSAIDIWVAERNRWEVIAIFVRNHFDTGDKSIAADLSLASYYMETEKAK